MIGNSTSQKIHRTTSRSLDSNILTQSWVLISEKRCMSFARLLYVWCTSDVRLMSVWCTSDVRLMYVWWTSDVRLMYVFVTLVCMPCIDSYVRTFIFLLVCWGHGTLYVAFFCYLGILSFYKGMSSALIRSFPANAALFLAYEASKQHLTKLTI